MRTKEEILKDEFGISIHAKDTSPMDKGECIKAMQEYADEFACAFTEWNKEKVPMGLYNDGTCIKPKILTELLEIFKKEQDGKV